MSLVKHAISCQCDLGKCTIPECAIIQRVMAFLSPSVARKRSRIEQQVYNRKRARIQSVTKKGQGHAQKVTHRPHVPAPKGEFIHYAVEYVIPRSELKQSLMRTLKKAKIELNMNYIK